MKSQNVPIMSLVMLLLVLFILLYAIVPTYQRDYPDNETKFPCRFAHNFRQEELIQGGIMRHQFMKNISYWEGKFHQHLVGYNRMSGLTYDGHGIDFDSGTLHDPSHPFTASSKESLHLNLITLALDKNPYAMLFFESSHSLGNQTLEQHLLTILERKINSYERFNQKYPGFGGFLPWFLVTDDGIELLHDWPDRVPSLDNGQLIWAMIASAYQLQQIGEYHLSQRYQKHVDLMLSNLLTIFYDGKGVIRGVSKIRDIKATPTPSNYYLEGIYILDDPYEGELVAVLMDLFGDWKKLNYTASESDEIWILKRKKLKAVEYQTPEGPITVERGYWHSSHEKWKYMVLPYLDIPINRRVFMNGERARTWHSYLNEIPGLFASVTNVSKKPNYNPIYLSACGIQPIASEIVTCTNVITPYASYPVMLADLGAGLIWYHNMLNGPRMQGPYGSTESVSIKGNAISPVITWDSKITTIVAMCGGIAPYTRQFLKNVEHYNKFYDRIETEWNLVFGETLKGENLPFKPPSSKIPHPNEDFTECQR